MSGIDIIIGFIVGCALAKWQISRKRVSELRRENQLLRRELDHALGAMKPRREFTKLHLLAGAPTPREAHSHATKGQAG